MAQIKVTNLTFCYDGAYDNIFENVNLSLDTDWRLGFVGRNGRGKTTFLNLLMGKYEYRGRIDAPVEFEYFPYEVADESADAIDAARGVYPDFDEWALIRELKKLEFREEALHRPYLTLSNGERTKLLIAVMFLRRNAFLLIDEPTNHLDLYGRELVARYLASKSGYILVSHDRAFLDRATDHTLSLNRGGIELIAGNYSVWKENRDRRDAFELSENEKLRREIGRLEVSAEEKARWSGAAESKKIGFDPTKTEKTIGSRSYQGAKSEKMMRRAKSIERRREGAITEKRQLLKNLEEADTLKISCEPYFRERLISCRELAVDYGAGSIFEPVTFELRRGDRLALRGRNGCGKSSIIKLALGENIPHSGTFDVGSGLKISLVPQDASGLRGDLRDYCDSEGIDETLFKAILRKLDFTRTQFEKDMADFSAGQKKKVLLASSLSKPANIFIWDEPLNYIDLLSRVQLEELIKKFAPTMLFVEHDAAFVDAVATQVVDVGSRASI